MKVTFDEYLKFGIRDLIDHVNFRRRNGLNGLITLHGPAVLNASIRSKGSKDNERRSVPFNGRQQFSVDILIAEDDPKNNEIELLVYLTIPFPASNQVDIRRVSIPVSDAFTICSGFDKFIEEATAGKNFDLFSKMKEEEKSLVRNEKEWGIW